MIDPNVHKTKKHLTTVTTLYYIISFYNETSDFTMRNFAVKTNDKFTEMQNQSTLPTHFCISVGR